MVHAPYLPRGFSHPWADNYRLLRYSIWKETTSQEGILIHKIVNTKVLSKRTCQFIDQKVIFTWQK